jgi:hypothetical protein
MDRTNDQANRPRDDGMARLVIGGLLHVLMVPGCRHRRAAVTSTHPSVGCVSIPFVNSIVRTVHGNGSRGAPRDLLEHCEDAEVT